MTDQQDRSIADVKSGKAARSGPETTESEESETFFRGIVENVPDPLFVVERDGTVGFVNEAGEQLFGYEREELVGRPITTVLPDDVGFGSAAQGEQWVRPTEMETSARHRDGHEIPVTVSFSEHGAGGELFVCLVRDVTRLREREQALREEQAFTESVLDTVPDVLYAFDTHGRFLRWNDRAREATGYTDEEIGEMHPLDFIPEEDHERISDAIATILSEGTVESRESSLVTKDGRHVPYEFNSSRIADDEGTVLGVTGVGRDISEQKAKQRELEATKEKYRELVETAPDAVLIADVETGIIEEANRAAENLLGKSREELCGMHQSELHPSEEAERYAAIFEEHGERGGSFAQGSDLYVVHDDGHRIPVEINAAVVELDDGPVIQGVFRDISRQKERARELTRQRDELETLNRINTVVRGINRGLIGATTRKEIEQMVCDRLVADERYRFAWVGEVDAGTSNITPRTWSGAEEGYLSEITVTADDEETGRGPTGRALRAKEVQVTQGIDSDAAYEPWRAAAIARGYRSSAAIPLVYEGGIYGVLNLYASRPNAFDERERTVLGELGHAIGHAMNALDRKRALMSDTAVEVELRIGGVPQTLSEELRGASGCITFERTIPADDGSFLQYVTMTGLSVESFLDFAEQTPSITRVRQLDQEGDEHAFEVTYSDPPLLSAIATHGGRVRTATIENGEFRITAELPDGADVRAVVESIESKFPDIDLVSQRNIARPGQTTQEYRATIEDRLTDKQRAALEAAYFAGYFERPRRRTGGEIADSLGITASTFHQHLQAGLRKFLAVGIDRRRRDS